MITLHLPNCLQSFPEEAAIVGRIVIQYGEIEWMLCRVVGGLIGDFEAAMKSMYRVRGELSRLEIADALVTNRRMTESFALVYENTLEGVETCRVIRNSYAHAHWLSSHEEKFGFYDLERLAKRRDTVTLSELRISVLSKELLIRQEVFFSEVLHNLIHMFYEVDFERNDRPYEARYLRLQTPPRATWAER
ncbi:MAG TPA: hypothetical protein VFO80_02610 [Sphingomonas sp.]|nr:hypothetical protein [Sphingomonas sp.]